MVDEGAEGGEGIVLGVKGFKLLFEGGFVVAEEEADYVAPWDFYWGFQIKPLPYYLEESLNDPGKFDV